ncbi:MAG: amidohydrolase family protein [Pontibacterium sp.]
MSQRVPSSPQPKRPLPKGAIDTHCHVYSPDFADQAGGPPSPSDYPDVDQYQAMQAWLGFEHTVIVQANAHQHDNRCMLAALSAFNGNARGVAAITPDMSEDTLARLHKAGVRGARIMEFEGGAVGIKSLHAVDARIADLGWHCIVQFDGSLMDTYSPFLNNFESTYILDHVMKFQSPTGVNDPQFKTLLKLIDKGNCYIKLSAIYESSRTGGPLYEDVGTLAKALIAHAPERILWGTNWPHASQPINQAPNDAHLQDVIDSWIPDDATRQKIYVDNPRKLYDF